MASGFVFSWDLCICDCVHVCFLLLLWLFFPVCFVLFWFIFILYNIILFLFILLLLIILDSCLYPNEQQKREVWIWVGGEDLKGVRGGEYIVFKTLFLIF